MTSIIQRYRALTRREQLLIGGLLGLLLVLLLFFGVIRPILGFAEASREDYARAQRVAALAETIEPEEQGPRDERAIRSVVTELADQRRIVYTRINAISGGALQLDLENVPYATFFSWLDELERDRGIVVVEAYVAPGEKAETVEARVTVRRAG